MQRLIRFTLLGWLILLVVPVQAATVSGLVYVDANGNGACEAGEQPLAGVLVSDGGQVVSTDARGRYVLPLSQTGTLVRLSIPSGYWPAGHRWFERVASAEAATCDFPLRAETQASPWRMVQVTDIHHIVPATDKISAFCEQINAAQPPVALVVSTGDLVMDSNPVRDETIIRRLFTDYALALAPLQVPLFNVPGNHDHPQVRTELSPEGPLYGQRGYEALVGPPWYSFDYAGVHLLALNASLVDSTARSVPSGFSAECLAWLRADLALTPPETPLLIFCHQPPGTCRNSQTLQAALAGRRVLGIFCGHTHAAREYDWAGYRVYESGALSGAWWTGPCPDGKPRGFRLLKVTPEEVETEYVSAAEPEPVAATQGSRCGAICGTMVLPRQPE